MSDFEEKPINYMAFIQEFRDNIANEIATSNYDSLDLYKRVVGGRMALDDLLAALNAEIEKRKKRFK